MNGMNIYDREGRQLHIASDDWFKIMLAIRELLPPEVAEKIKLIEPKEKP